MTDEDYLLQLTRICQNLGAPPEQAETMARQLQKRAKQLARERSISEVEALQYLLELVKRGREGDVPPQFPSKKGSSATEK